MVDVWFQDDSRFEQQNSISRVRAEKGSRLGLIRQQQFISTCFFTAACRERDLVVPLALPAAVPDDYTTLALMASVQPRHYWNL